MNSLPGAFPGKMRRVTSTAVGVTLAALMVGSGALPASAGQSNRVKSWGANSFGQLGDATLTERSTPVTVAGMAGADVTQVSASGDHSLALLSNGTVEAWGDNFSGQLGDGTSGRNADHSTPGTVKDLRNVRAVAAGGSHNLALRNDGTVWAWGVNLFGQLGNGTPGTGSSTPVMARLTNVKAIAAGGAHGLALRNDGTVWAWGRNDFGQLGNGEPGISSPFPVRVAGLDNVKAIAAGSKYSLALLNDGTVRAWGRNDFGQLGNGTPGTGSSTPVMARLTNVKAVAAGGDHALALLNDGTVRAWGANDFGQLGNGESGTRSFTPVAVLGLKDVSLIAAGRFHSLAYPRRGPVTTWGLNDHGQLGDGSTTARTVPKSIPTGRGGIVSIAGGDSHSLIV
jgi:alpha-tubulin suppressor-like RCC1 family protein